jgi:hypothetical protein
MERKGKRIFTGLLYARYCNITLRTQPGDKIETAGIRSLLHGIDKLAIACTSYRDRSLFDA